MIILTILVVLALIRHGMVLVASTGDRIYAGRRKLRTK